MSTQQIRQGWKLTHLCETYVAAGLLCEISTNSKRIPEFARELFTEGPPRQTPVDIRLRFWVDGQARTAAPRPKPHFRGLGQLVFAGFDSVNSLLVDLRTRPGIGRFAEPVASDRTCWKAIIFPMLLSVVAASSNVVELHCACVERRGEGLLLAGSSGSGKSTLSLALARNGFAFVSDDRTCISTRDGQLWAWPWVTPLPRSSWLNPHLLERNSIVTNLLDEYTHWTRPSDPNIIPLGGWLQRSNLDEVPQFLNVLKGSTSLAGCRLERPLFLEQLARRFRMTWFGTT